MPVKTPAFNTFADKINAATTKQEIAKVRCEAIQAISFKKKNKRKNIEIVFDSFPQYILHPETGLPIGLEAHVSVYDLQGNKLDIDPHRRFINPPTVVRDKINDKYSFDPEEAFLIALEESISSHPNPRNK